MDIVRIWDTVGQDNVLKGEYKVISGAVYVVITQVDIGLIVHGVATISHGMVRASGSLPSGMDERSEFTFVVISEYLTNSDHR